MRGGRVAGLAPDQRRLILGDTAMPLPTPANNDRRPDAALAESA
jgi:hypothetical protein